MHFSSVSPTRKQPPSNVSPAHGVGLLATTPQCSCPDEIAAAGGGAYPSQNLLSVASGLSHVNLASLYSSLNNATLESIRNSQAAAAAMWEANLSRAAAAGPSMGALPVGYPYFPTHTPVNDMALYPPYQYGSFASDATMRRKNATRETTSALKAWLQEHLKNPYPTKGEKIMLAIITKMTLTQVSTWFANARRRLKKENKMTWVPKSKSEEDEDGDFDENGEEEEAEDGHHDNKEESVVEEGSPEEPENKGTLDEVSAAKKVDISEERPSKSLPSPPKGADLGDCSSLSPTCPNANQDDIDEDVKVEVTEKAPSHNSGTSSATPTASPTDESRPKGKIWSIVDTATSPSLPVARKINSTHFRDSLKDVAFLWAARRHMAAHPYAGYFLEDGHLQAAGSRSLKLVNK